MAKYLLKYKDATLEGTKEDIEKFNTMVNEMHQYIKKIAQLDHVESINAKQLLKRIKNDINE